MARAQRKETVVVLLLFLAGVAAAAYLHWPALRTNEVYNTDIRQSPHWAAYHTDAFRADDPILRYAAFNESPLQNAIYWTATLFVPYIPLTKILALVGYGLATVLFFLLARSLYDQRVGLLAVAFFTFVPNHFEFSVGFFSKFWAMPCVLVCLYLLQAERWRGLIALIPFAALAYPTAAVVLGATCCVHVVGLALRDRARARALAVSLAIGSVVAAALLMVKYFQPPDFIGAPTPRAELLSLLEQRDSPYVPVPPLWAELWERVGHPFVLLASAAYLLVLGFRGVCWERAWTSLVLASAALYVVAEIVFARLYIPNRYTRYSLAVLLVLWHATNCGRLLARIPRPGWRISVLALVFLVAGVAYRDTFERGEHTTIASYTARLSAFLARLPPDALIACPPRTCDDVAIQARRRVLTTFKLNHGWYARHHELLRERSLAYYRALFAADEAAIDEMHSRYGATHLVVSWSYLGPRRHWGMYHSRYDEQIHERIVGDRTDFLLPRLPKERFLYEDGAFGVLELPLRRSGPSGESDAR